MKEGKLIPYRTENSALSMLRKSLKTKIDFIYLGEEKIDDTPTFIRKYEWKGQILKIKKIGIICSVFKDDTYLRGDD